MLKEGNIRRPVATRKHVLKARGNFFSRTKHRRAQTRKILHQKRPRDTMGHRFRGPLAGFWVNWVQRSSCQPGLSNKKKLHYSDKFRPRTCMLKNAHRVIQNRATIAMITVRQQRVSTHVPFLRTVSFSILAPSFTVATLAGHEWDKNVVSPSPLTLMKNKTLRVARSTPRGPLESKCCQLSPDASWRILSLFIVSWAMGGPG